MVLPLSTSAVNTSLSSASPQWSTKQNQTRSTMLIQSTSIYIPLYLLAHSHTHYAHYIMLLSNSLTSHIALQDRAKIFTISPCHNGYLFVSVLDQHEKLVHIDSKGKVLWEKLYVDSVDDFLLINDREAIVLNVKRKLIELVDLQSHHIRCFNHSFERPDTSYMQLMGFYERRLFCIVEKDTDQDFLCLSYYQYDAQGVHFLDQYKNSSFGERAEIAKANNSSMVIWWKPDQKDVVSFNSIWLSAAGRVSEEVVSVDNHLQWAVGLDKVQIQLHRVWQASDGVYMIYCDTSAHADKEGNTPSCVYVVDTAMQTLRQARFSLGEFSKRVVDHFTIGEYSAFYCLPLKDEPSMAPVYYVHNPTESIKLTGKWSCNAEEHHILPCYDPNAIVEATYYNGFTESVAITLRRLETQREMYLHFLLHINEDFDDDLLQDSLELLGVI